MQVSKAVLCVVAAVLLAVTLYYGVIFQGQLPDHPILRGQNDLFLHFVAFLALAVPVCLLLPRWPSVTALTIGAALIEAVQMFQPDRNADLKDFAASVLGVLAGAACAALFQRGFQRISKT